MSGDGTERRQAEEHSLRIFEERNRAFRVLFDTVMEVEGASDEAVYAILCRNLLRLCRGRAAALALYDPARETMTLECACRRSEAGEVSIFDRPGIVAAVGEEAAAAFREKQVQECQDHRGCLVDIFSGSSLDRLNLEPEKNCYRLSCVRGGELIAGGMIQLAPGRPLRLKDVIDTYLNLAGLIIQRLQVSRALRHSEKEKAVILDSLEELVTFQSRELRLIWANRSAAESVGLEEVRLEGRHCYELWHGRSVPCDNCPVAEAIATGSTREAEMTTPDGRIWLVRGYPVTDEAGEVIGAVEITRNITEWKRAEEDLLRHSLVYRSMQEAVLIFDREDRIIDLNPAAEKIFGRTRDELLGWKADVLNPPERVEEIVSGIRRGLERKGVWEGEIPVVTGTGEERIMSALVSSIYDREGKLIGNIGINRDITERKRQEEETLKFQKLESLGVLAGGIAHDFNNLLMAIMGNISLAKLHLSRDSDLYLSLDEAESSCLQARNLTQQLLTFSRGGRPVKEVVRIADLIRESAGLALSGSRSRGVFPIADHLWPVNADPGQIHQVVNNLVINAVQAMPEGGLVEIAADNITVGGERAPALEEGRYVRVAVRDHGVGIREKYLARIFDPYFTTKKQGSGLGLATVYSIVKNHGGLITVDSHPERGTVFTFYLPASPEEPVPSAGGEEGIVRGEGRVLLMDDEAGVRRVCLRMLEDLGYEVETAAEGREAVEKYRLARRDGRPFDCVILDLTVRDGLGGRETIRELRELDPGVRAVVTSGYSTDAVMADHEKYGFRGVIVKPYKIRDLSATLRRVMAAGPG